jgi:hypothetical protein
VKPDWEAITAVGTLLAVFVALFQEPVRRWWRAPKLCFGWRHYNDEDHRAHGDRLRITRHVHVVVKNKGRDPAQRVQVSLVGVFRIDEETRRYARIERFVPAPLRWTHSHSDLCEYLARGWKLCDLGTHERFSRAPTEDTFTFSTISEPPREYRIRSGLYVFRLMAAALNCDPAHLTIVVRLGGPIPWVSNVPNAKIRAELRKMDRSEGQLEKQTDRRLRAA